MRGEIPSIKIWDDEKCFAIRDVAPISPVHILVIPKVDIPQLSEADSSHKELLGHLLFVSAEVARQEKISESGYRVVINSGESAGQTVFQLHLHVVGGREFSWPPG